MLMGFDPIGSLRISRKIRVSVGASILVANLACGGILSPDLSAASGLYRLETVDGKALPVALADGPCPNAIMSGSAGLTPRIANAKPLYSVSAFAALLCDPTKVVFGEDEPLHDAGEWTYDAPRVRFKSNQGFGDYSIPLEDGESSNPVDVILRFNLGGHIYVFRRTDANPR